MSSQQQALTEKEQRILKSYGLTAKSKLKFFVREPRLLFIVSFLTLGMYDVYWVYRNWQAVQAASKDKMSPLWRTVFTIFYIYPLFKIMRLSAKRYGFERDYSAGLLAIGYVIIPLIGVLNYHPERTTLTWFIYLSQLLGAATSILFLVTAQQAAIAANASGRKEVTFERFGRLEIVLVVIGVLVAISTIPVQ
jgi:hypothetical protein